MPNVIFSCSSRLHTVAVWEPPADPSRVVGLVSNSTLPSIQHGVLFQFSLGTIVDTKQFLYTFILNLPWFNWGIAVGKFPKFSLWRICGDVDQPCGLMMQEIFKSIDPYHRYDGSPRSIPFSGNIRKMKASFKWRGPTIINFLVVPSDCSQIALFKTTAYAFGYIFKTWPLPSKVAALSGHSSNSKDLPK